MGQPQACEWVHKLHPILNEALGSENQLPERQPARLEAVLQQYPSLEFMIDGSERPIHRPKDQERQQDYYSGKKKRHTVTHRVIIERGFQGFAPVGVTVKQPQKKPRNGTLSDVPKQQNQEISGERVEVEHHIGGIKRCNSVVHKFRNRIAYFVDDVIETACGLHNLRLSQRQLKAA